MKHKTKLLTSAIATLMFTLSLSLVAMAQDREQYVISAKAGGVNSVFGNVTIKRRGTTDIQTLTTNDDLNSGDLVQTSNTGRVEVLLNPGSYLRASENSEFELTNASLDSLQVKVLRGSFIVEVAGADEALTLIDVATPQSRISIDRKGVYRINLVSDGATEVLVHKGRAAIGEGSSAIELKDGKKILIGDGSTTVVKFDKKLQDSFDLWSQERANTLVAANRRLSDRTIASSFSNYSNTRFGWERGYRSSGFWIYDPFFRSRTFLPFYSGWSSPYGRGYSRGFGFSWYGRFSGFGLGTYRSPRIIITPRRTTRSSSGAIRWPNRGSVGHPRPGGRRR